MKIIDVFRLAFKMEKEGQDFYAVQKQRVKNKVLHDIFESLEKMEEDHAAYIEKQVENLNTGINIDPLSDSGDNPFQSRFSEQEIKTEALKEDLGDYSILRMAYLIEKDFVQFYSKAAENVNGEEKQVLELLSKWEEGHAAAIRKQMETILAKNRIDLGFYPF